MSDKQPTLNAPDALTAASGLPIRDAQTILTELDRAGWRIIGKPGTRVPLADQIELMEDGPRKVVLQLALQMHPDAEEISWSQPCRDGPVTVTVQMKAPAPAIRYGLVGDMTLTKIRL
jgi:hypothetical protein